MKLNDCAHHIRMQLFGLFVLVLAMLIVPSSGRAATGGPDAFGYTWADQAEATCSYNFVDISATGLQIVNGDDTASGGVALSAPFDFYGTVYNQLNMASNGYITTDPADTGPDLSNDCPLPVTPSTGGGARMYPLHDDLELVAGTGRGLIQYFAVCPRPSDRNPGEACTVFMWDDVTHYGGGGPWDMEAIVYHQSNDFVFQIGPGNPELGSGSTTGIQDPPPPTTGLTYACNTAGSIPDNTAVCFFHPGFSPAAIPTLSEWGMIIMGLLLGIAAITILRNPRFRTAL